MAGDRAHPNPAAPDDTWIWVVLSLVALATVAIVASGWPGGLLWVAATAVGAMGGQWFATKGTRDQLAFITGAGAFLFLAALEYDHKLFGNLSKIGGSELSIEFSDKGRNSAQDTRSVIGSSNGTLGRVFPGNSGLRLAISTLKELPQSMVLDDYYSYLFSYDSISENYRLDKWPSPPMKYLYSYFCDKITDFTAKLLVLPPSEEGEVTLSGLNPELIMELQALYFTNSQSSVKVPENVRKILFEEAGLLKKEIDDQQLTSKINADPVVTMCNKDPPTRIKIDDNDPLPSQKELVENDGSSSYLALTLSLIEFAGGARESAIQVLEERIKAELKKLKELYPRPPTYDENFVKCPAKKSDGPNNCADVQSNKRDYLRKIIPLARLEFDENIMMDYLSVSSADLSKLRRWIGTSSRFEEGMFYFDSEGKFRKSLERPSFDDERPAECAPELRGRGRRVAYLFGRFVFSDFTAKNNALNLVNNNPSIIKSQPILASTLDQYAEEVGSLDINCIALLTDSAKPDGPQTNEKVNSTLVLPTLTIEGADVRSRFLESVAGYWEVRADPAEPEESATSRQIETLCKARSAYELALQYANAAIQSGQNDGAGSADFDWRNGNVQAEAQNDDQIARPARIKDALSRVRKTLSNLPAADVNAACR